jgi:hypothetical protein
MGQGGAFSRGATIGLGLTAASALKQQCVDSIVGVTDEPVWH